MTPITAPGGGGGGDVEGEGEGDEVRDEDGDGDCDADCDCDCEGDVCGAVSATTKTALARVRHVSSFRASSGKSSVRAALLKTATAGWSAGVMGAMVHGGGGDGEAAWGGASLACMVRGDADVGCRCRCRCRALVGAYVVHVPSSIEVHGSCDTDLVGNVGLFCGVGLPVLGM